MKIKIRNFEKKDLRQVLELCNEVREYHRELLGGYFTPQNDEDEKQPFLESLINDKILAWVAVNGQDIEGLLLADTKNSPHLERPRIAHICNIGVKKSSQGRGIGSLLMDTFYKYCQDKDIQEIKLGVFNKNTNAYRFYESFGFEPQEQKMSLAIKNKDH